MSKIYKYITDADKVELDVIVQEIVAGRGGEAGQYKGDVFYSDIMGRINHNSCSFIVKNKRKLIHLSISCEAFSYVCDQLREVHQFLVHS